MAFYFLDWDRQKRVQKVEVLDGFGQATSTIEVRDFENGKYVVVYGADFASLRITCISGPNAVLSGIFVGGPFTGSTLGTAPTILPNGGDFEGPVDVEIVPPTADSRPYVTLDGSDPAVNGMYYSGPIRLTESRMIRAVARNKYGQSLEAFATFTISPIQEVEFLGEDRATLGNWMGNYGQGAYALPFFEPTLPITTAGASSWVWNWLTPDLSALQKPRAAQDRYAACWYNTHSFDISVPIGNGTERTLAVYALDWDNAGRVQQIDIIDTERQLVVDSQRLSNFADGVYLQWKVRNDVTIRVISRGGPNAVLSGVFVDPGPALEQVHPPGFVYGGAPGEPVRVDIGTGTDGAEIYYTLDGLTPSRSSTLYTGPFYLTSDTTVSAIAYKEGMLPSDVASVFIDVAGATSPTGTAEFLSEDSTTQGTWRGVYGQAGFWIVGDWASVGSGNSAEISGAHEHVWAFNISDPAALQKHSSAERLAACRYAAEAFSVVVDRTIDAPRVVSLYFLDWDEAGRAQKVEVLNQDGTILDSRNVSHFENGKYFSWRVSGRVTFRITRILGPNAVLSGLFFE